MDKPIAARKIRSGGNKIGKQAAEKSRGLFSADDWMCKTLEVILVNLKISSVVFAIVINYLLLDF